MGATGMMGAMVLQGTNSISSSISQSQALKSQGAFQSQQAGFNSNVANLQSQDAINRGNIQEDNLRRQTNQQIGAQRVAMAAQGINIDSGSAKDVTDSTSAMSALDAVTIKNNAMRESWGYQVQALNYTSQGQFDSMAANNQSNSTFLTGGMSALGDFAKAGYYSGGGSSRDSSRGIGGKY